MRRHQNPVPLERVVTNMLMIFWVKLRHVTLLVSGAKKTHLNLFIYLHQKDKHYFYENKHFKFKIVFC